MRVTKPRHVATLCDMSHPGPSKQTRERMDQIADYMAEYGWRSAHAYAKFCKEWGVGRRQVRDIRLRALKEIAAEAEEDSEAGVIAAEFLGELERHTDRASKDGAHGPVSSMLKIRQTVLGIEKAPQEQGGEVTIEEQVEAVSVALAEDPEFAAAVRAAMVEMGAWERFVGD